MSQTFYPEGDTILATDNALRTAQKTLSMVNDSLGEVAVTGFPEGSASSPADNLLRVYKKIKAHYTA